MSQRLIEEIEYINKLLKYTNKSSLKAKYINELNKLKIYNDIIIKGNYTPLRLVILSKGKNRGRKSKVTVKIFSEENEVSADKFAEEKESIGFFSTVVDLALMYECNQGKISLVFILI